MSVSLFSLFFFLPPSRILKISILVFWKLSCEGNLVEMCVFVCVKSPTVKTMSSVDMQKRTVQRCYGGWGNSQESEHAFFVRAGLEREARQQIHNCYYYHYHYCDFIFKTTAKNKKKKTPRQKNPTALLVSALWSHAFSEFGYFFPCLRVRSAVSAAKPYSKTTCRNCL